MSKNTYTVVNSVTNEVIFEAKSGAVCYYHILDELTKDENLGTRAKIIQNFGTDNEKVCNEFISVKANSGVNYLYIYEKYLKMQQRHADAIAKREAYEKARDARKAARLAAKAAKLEANKTEQPVEQIEQPAPTEMNDQQPETQPEALETTAEPEVEAKAAAKKASSNKKAKAKK